MLVASRYSTALKKDQLRGLIFRALLIPTAFAERQCMTFIIFKHSSDSLLRIKNVEQFIECRCEYDLSASVERAAFCCFVFSDRCMLSLA